MKISRQADYALRTILYMARIGVAQQTSTNNIAVEQKIPISFLRKIVFQLAISGMLVTSRGKRGGIALALPPSEISLLAVVEAIDGPIWLNECVANPDSCYFGTTCTFYDIWCKAQAELVHRLKSTTFDMLINSKN